MVNCSVTSLVFEIRENRNEDDDDPMFIYSAFTLMEDENQFLTWTPAAEIHPPLFARTFFLSYELFDEHSLECRAREFTASLCDKRKISGLERETIKFN